MPAGLWESVLGSSVLAFLYWWWQRPAQLPFFPGPKRLPVVGNLFNLPKGPNEWVTYAQWGKELGTDIVHMDVLGAHVVVVNSTKAAYDLFEKQSSIYSDRPPLVALNQLLKVDWILGFLPYGQRWRTYRKAFHEHFNASAVHQYKPLEVKSTHQLLRRLLDDPDKFMDNIRHMAGQTILSIAYGIDVKPVSDPYVATAEKTLHSIALGASMGRHLDMMPWLTRMPWWFPGAGFKKIADELRHHGVAMLEEPYRAVKKAMAEGNAAPSVASARISQLDVNSSAEDIDMAKLLPGNIYLGGADTTVAAIQTFFLAMVVSQAAQKKAQAEIDSVIGYDRLPGFEDEESLPYVQALVKEVLRWHPTVPLAIPHRLEVDHVYDGQLIPRGSIVFGNAWAMLHDESVFPDPETFKPERFLEDPSMFPEFAFGFGRRACPGQFMAYDSVWITVACVLAAFDVAPATDERGREIKAEENYASGIVSYPAPFPCQITPRSNAARDLVLGTLPELSS